MSGNVKTIQNQEAVLAEAKRLNDEGMSWRKIVKRLDLGVSEGWFMRRLVPGYSALRNAQTRARFQPCLDRSRGNSGGCTNPRPMSDEALKRYRAAIPPDARDLTGRVFGDPPPHRSALAQKQLGPQTGGGNVA